MLKIKAPTSRLTFRKKLALNLVISTTKEVLIRALRPHGEETAAAMVPDMTDEQFRAVGERAGWFVYSLPSRRKDGSGIFLDTALALAAVEQLEGQSRDLRWKRRRLKGLY
jgi:hypothetical protein